MSMTKKEREEKIESLTLLRDRFYEKYRKLQDEINDLTQQEYDDYRVYRTGERARDSRLDCITGLG